MAHSGQEATACTAEHRALKTARAAGCALGAVRCKGSVRTVPVAPRDSAASRVHAAACHHTAFSQTAALDKSYGVAAIRKRAYMCLVGVREDAQLANNRLGAHGVAEVPSHIAGRHVAEVSNCRLIVPQHHEFSRTLTKPGRVGKEGDAGRPQPRLVPSFRLQCVRENAVLAVPRPAQAEPRARCNRRPQRLHCVHIEELIHITDCDQLAIEELGDQPRDEPPHRDLAHKGGVGDVRQHGRCRNVDQQYPHRL
eukprot:1810500-Prymnesium_polylepis.1